MGLLARIREFVWNRHFVKKFGILILIYLVVITIVILYLDSYTNHGQKIEVPNLVGKNVNSIQAILEEKDLEYEIVESKYDPTKPEGTIWEQDPMATEITDVFVKEGRSVRLRITKKSHLVEVPSLIDKSERFAIQVLKSRGLTYKLEYENSTEANGAVLAQKFQGKEIKDGQKIQIGSRITLVVGRNQGGEPVQIPNLVGQSYQGASELLSTVSGVHLLLVCPNCATAADSSSAIIESQSPEFTDGVLSPFGSTVTVLANPN